MVNPLQHTSKAFRKAIVKGLCLENIYFKKRVPESKKKLKKYIWKNIQS